MSLELHVYCNRKSLPTSATWSKALAKAGLPAKLPAINWKRRHGFLPITIAQEQTGCEVDLFKNGPEENPPDGGKRFDSIVAFRYASTGVEAALALSGTLAQLTNGYPYNPDHDQPLSPEDSLDQARRLLAPQPQGAQKVFEFQSSWKDTLGQSPAEWIKHTEGLLQETIHTEYRRNRRCTGNQIEFVRPHSSGVLFSLNYLRRKTLGEFQYNDCFAILLGELGQTQGIYSLLIAGARFDHNDTVYRQLTMGLSGTNSQQWTHQRKEPNYWLNDYIDLLWHAEEAELYLLPFYFRRLRKAAPRLAAFLSFVRRTFKSLPSSKSPPLGKVLAAAGIDLKTGNRYRQYCINVGALTFADPDSFKEVPHKLLHPCLLAHNLRDMWSIRDQLPTIIAGLRSLTKSRS